MTSLRTSPCVGALVAIGLGAIVSLACSDRSPTGPSVPPLSAGHDPQGIQAAIVAHGRHATALLHIPGVVGTAVGLLPNGRAALRVFLAKRDVRGLPSALDGIPVAAEVTGQFVAFGDPTTRQRPAPIGFSLGHPDITAGSIAARVVDGSGHVYVLSNNHVLANSNNAEIGDPALQPGPYDGGTVPADQIGTLFAFKPIDFSGGDNTIDAAIATSDASAVGNATPTDDGYGTPSAAIFGDANGDGVFDDKSALLGLNVQKYGRTTKLTKGQITGIDGTVTVCYEVFIIFCLESATFVDQLVIEPGSFSGGGDSGSLIVSDDQNMNPVGLLFAGSPTETIANRIDLVLNYFGVRVDGSAPPPPPPPGPPVTDLAITKVSAPASVIQGTSANVGVTVKNVGNQDVTASFDVTLQDATDNVTVGTQSVAGLASGASTTLTYGWNTTGSGLGTHTLTASHTFADDSASNNQASTTVAVKAPSTLIHVGDLDGIPSSNGTTWSATVEITVHDANHDPLDGATVRGTWSASGLNASECTTGDLGGNGTCIVLFPSLRRGTKSVTFRVTSVTMPDRTYDPSANHDPDGSSNGTAITVRRR